MFCQNIEFPRHIVGIADQVRFVGVLGDHAECLLLAATADHDGDPRDGCRFVDRLFHRVVLAVQARALSAKHRDDDLQGFLEFFEALREGAEAEPQGVVLELEPARADTEGGSSGRDVIEGRDGLRQERRISVGVACHQCREPHPGGVLGQRRE